MEKSVVFVEVPVLVTAAGGGSEEAVADPGGNHSVALEPVDPTARIGNPWLRLRSDRLTKRGKAMAWTASQRRVCRGGHR